MLSEFAITKNVPCCSRTIQFEQACLYGAMILKALCMFCIPASFLDHLYMVCCYAAYRVYTQSVESVSVRSRGCKSMESAFIGNWVPLIRKLIPIVLTAEYPSGR